MSQDMNILLMKKAIEVQKEVIIIPRRSHTIKGIPINFEDNILRVWINTGKSIESVLYSEIGHFSFSVELWNMVDKTNNVRKENNGKKKKIDRKEPIEQFKKLEEKTQVQKDRDKHNEFIEQKEVKNET